MPGSNAVRMPRRCPAVRARRQRRAL